MDPDENPLDNLAHLGNRCREGAQLAGRLREQVNTHFTKIQLLVAQRKLINNARLSTGTSKDEPVPQTSNSGAVKEKVKEANEQSKEKVNSPTTNRTIFDFPNEIMYKILKFLPFSTIGEKRMVCSYFNNMCSDILISEFKCLRNVIQGRLTALKSQMPRRESARRQHPLAREFDIIETVNMRLSLLQTIFSKHIERGHCAFFAGAVLDEVHRILRYLKTTPEISVAYKVTDELFDLSSMSVEYFKERIEPTLPDISYIAGLNDIFLYESGSSSVVSSNSLDNGPSCSKSFENIPDYCSPPTSDYSSLATIKSPDYLSTFEKLNPNTPDSMGDESPRRRPLSVSLSRLANRRIKRLEVRNKRANKTIRFLKSGLYGCRRKLVANEKQIRKCNTHLDEYDKKFESTCAKLNLVLEELTKCKTEIQYLRTSNSSSQGTPEDGGAPSAVGGEATLLLTPESPDNVAHRPETRKRTEMKRKLEFVASQEPAPTGEKCAKVE